MLLTGAGLLTRSLINLQHQNFGYELDHRLTLSLTAPFSSYPQPKLDAEYREMQDRLQAIPGVQRAALALYTPLDGNWGEIVIRQGHGMPNMNDPVGSSWNHVSPGYLEDAGPENSARAIPERGRYGSTQNVAVVDETFVKRFFKPGEDPIGQLLRVRPAAVQQHLQNCRCGSECEIHAIRRVLKARARSSLCRWRSASRTRMR